MRYFNFLVSFDNGRQLMEFGVKKEGFPSRKYLGETVQQQHPKIDLSEGFSVTRIFEFNNEEDFNSYNQ